MPPRKTTSEKLAEAMELMQAQRYAPALKILEKLHEAALKKDTKSKNKVKRKPSAYNIFFKDNYAAIKAKHPGTAQKDLIQYIADEWRSHNGDVSDTSSVSSSSSAKPKKSVAKPKKPVAAKPKKPAAKPKKATGGW